MSPAPVYDLEGVSQRYGARTVLTVPSLRIGAATITGLVGANGSGKSTLLDLLGFIRPPARGVIRLNGMPATPFSDAVRDAGVTILNQNVYLLKRSVNGNVAYGLGVRGVRRGARERIAEALDAVGLSPAAFGRRPWYALSGGEAQRVALAARLALKPRVLLLDEPTASVDDHSARLIKQAALAARSRWGATLVIASHDIHWLHAICDDIVYLHAGRLLTSGFLTTIDGHWTSDGPRCWVHRLPDGQCIRATADGSPGPRRPPTVEAGSIALSAVPPAPNAMENQLSGRLTRLIYEKRTDGLIATVEVGSISFTCRLSREQAADLAAIPGRSVWLRFPLAAVDWLTPPADPAE